MSSRYETILRQHNLRDTMARRLVLEALEVLQKPLLHKEILAWIQEKNATINLVTIYRILESFTDLHVVHKHPSTGGYLLCSLPTQKGHHGFLSCQDCGTVQEFTDSTLCTEEDRIANQNNFIPLHHTTEIVGVCSHCS